MVGVTKAIIKAKCVGPGQASVYASSPVVPECNTAHFPLETDVVVVGGMKVEFEEFEKLVWKTPSGSFSNESKSSQVLTGFLLLQLGEPSHKSCVDVQGFQSCHRVRSNSWMVSVDRRAVGTSSPEVKNRVVWTFDDVSTLDQL